MQISRVDFVLFQTRTTDPNEDINQRYLKNWVNVADKYALLAVLKNWDGDLIFGRALKVIFFVVVRSPCFLIN